MYDPLGIAVDVHRTRYKVLKYLMDYDTAHPFVSMERAELIQELGVNENDLDESIKFLEENMLLETVWFMGGDYWTKISSNGIEEIDNAEKHPEKGTRFFPPARIIDK